MSFRGSWAILSMPGPVCHFRCLPQGCRALRPGEVTVTGIARTTGRRNWLTPADSPQENFWFVVDIAAIGRHMDLANVLPVFVEAAAGAEGTLPIGGQTRAELPNDHLQYAIIWFALAIALAVIYVIYVRGRARP